MLFWALVGLSAWITVGLILGVVVGRAARLGEPSQESLVPDCLAAGMTVEEIVAEYPIVDAAEVCVPSRDAPDLVDVDVRQLTGVDAALVPLHATFALSTISRNL